MTSFRSHAVISPRFHRSNCAWSSTRAFDNSGHGRRRPIGGLVSSVALRHPCSCPVAWRSCPQDSSGGEPLRAGERRYSASRTVTRNDVPIVSHECTIVKAAIFVAACVLGLGLSLEAGCDQRTSGPPLPPFPRLPDSGHSGFVVVEDVQISPPRRAHGNARDVRGRPGASEDSNLHSLRAAAAFVVKVA